MGDDFPDFDYDYGAENGSYGRFRSGCFVLLSLFLVVVLLAAFIPALLWLVSFQDNRPPAEPTPTPGLLGEAPAEPDEPVATQPPTEAVVNTETIEEIPTALPPPAVELDVNRIAFINDDGQLMTVAPDGSDARQLTRGRQRLRFPAWSPDGSQIAAIGTTGSAVAVYAVDAEAKRSQPIALYADRDKTPFYLYWSPDSKQISFLSSNTTGLALQLVPADGAVESQIVTTGSPFYWNWAADSRQMLIHAGESSQDARLEMIEVAGDGRGDPIANPGRFQTPVISADGRYWAYAEQTQGNSQVVIEDNETGVQQIQRHSGLTALGWSPAADVLAFISSDSPESDDFKGPLRLMDAATGEITLLSREKVLAFFWSPDGRYLAAFNFQGRMQNRGDISARAKGNFTKPARQFDLPPMELTIFDVATGEGRVILEFTPTLTFLSQFLPFFDQYALSHRLWSPQSDALVLPIQEGNVNQIVLISTKNGSTRILGEGDMSFWSQN